MSEGEAKSEMPDDGEAQILALKDQGNAALLAGTITSAIDLYTQALAISPGSLSPKNNAVILSNRAQAYIKVENYGLAISDATTAMEADPSYPKAYYRRGTAEFALNKPKAARKDFKMVCKLKPKDRDARARYRKHYTVAMAASPSQAWTILNRHARDDIAPLRLKELCTDTDRVNSLVEVHTLNESASERIRAAALASNNHDTHRQRNRILIADFSRQRMTLETLNHLMRLADAVDLKNFITTLAWGQNSRFDPQLSDAGSSPSRGKKTYPTISPQSNRNHGFSTR